MSFKQAKELVERMEFSEIAIRKSIDNLEKASCSFQQSLKLQEDIVNRLPYSDKKIINYESGSCFKYWFNYWYFYRKISFIIYQKKHL